MARCPVRVRRAARGFRAKGSSCRRESWCANCWCVHDDVLDELAAAKKSSTRFAFSRGVERGPPARRLCAHERFQGRGRPRDRRNGRRVIVASSHHRYHHPDPRSRSRSTARCWIMSQRYVQVLTAAGAVRGSSPAARRRSDARAIYERLDGLFLPGGVDIDPAAYMSHALSCAADRPGPRLDGAVVHALGAHRSEAGACSLSRAQLLNVAVGGSLYQDVGRNHPMRSSTIIFPVAAADADALAHEVASPRTRGCGRCWDRQHRR